MDFFKKRAREILTNERDHDFEGKPLSLANAYKHLKQIVKNPTVVHTCSDNKPHYLKPTFAMARNAVNGEKFLQMS